MPSGRAVPGVSYVAISPYGPSEWAGLWIYDSTPYAFKVQNGMGHVTTYVISGWYGVGGTSCGAPQWFALVAGSLSAGVASGGLIAPTIYSHSTFYENYFNALKPWGSLNNNGYYYYSRGWDAITGWGSSEAGSLLTLLQQ